ncbi:PREDICTED: myosin-2 essential light chain-like isoform X1 [Amphimedon queenslandica]|uniref:EF-hand domain-containing protein n=1 Tax=Amphimedon queenslandica TaxID=400682 RepID=A0AAN0IIT6_AMPQE|nr:PREDICTED: myosin-2 essential light chain-like isoform X1 [Amphimedon queenslandica]|eukprot:XP_003390482.1 PREDICTED: myosin-2 essential light chain-like isoform X1 [Amphimedon queenslandica]
MANQNLDRITEDQTVEYRDAFALFDKRGDNKIDSDQIGDVLRALGLNPSEAEVKKIVQEVDPKGNKRVTFEEFLPCFLSCSQKKEQGSMEDFIEGLRVFDKDGNGFINSAELRHVLTSLGEKLTDEEVDTLLQGIEDGQGQVNYEEFVKMVMSG